MFVSEYIGVNRTILTVMPCAGGDANKFLFVFSMVDYCAETKTRDCKRWHFLGCLRICFGEWVDVFGIRDNSFQFAP